MSFSTIIHLGPLSFHLYYVYLVLLFLVALFLYWYEGIRDGFDKEKLFDLLFLSIFAAGATAYIINYFSFYYLYLQENILKLTLYAYFVFSLIFIRGFSMKWKWSVYRLLDIFSIIFFFITLVVFGVTILTLTSSKLIYLLILLVFTLTFILTYLMKNRLFSGLTFSVLLIITTAFGLLLYKQQDNLIFYGIMITTSLINLLFRSRKKMFNRNLSMDFLKKITNILRSKDKRLQMDQKKLIENDPYLQEGRDTANAEEMDEAILEDRAKVEHDIRQEEVEDMSKQVKKALDRVEKGEYGICEVCGKPIDKARLEVYPEATTCIDHADTESDSE